MNVSLGGKLLEQGSGIDARQRFGVVDGHELLLVLVLLPLLDRFWVRTVQSWVQNVVVCRVCLKLGTCLRIEARKLRFSHKWRIARRILLV